MAPQDLPSYFKTTQVYSGVEKRTLTSKSEDQGVLYEGKRGLNSIIIRQHHEDANAHSFKMCEEHKNIYILTSLEDFPHEDMHFFVYENYTSLAEWMQDRRNVVRDGQFTDQFIQIYGELNMSLYF